MKFCEEIKRIFVIQIYVYLFEKKSVTTASLDTGH